MIYSTARRAPRPGKALLLIALMAGLLSGCKTASSESGYPGSLPILEAPPREFACRHGQQERSCTAVLTTDWERQIRRSKAMCLALGGSPQACQTDLDQARP